MGRSLKREYLFGISPCLAAMLAKRREIFSLIMCKSLQDADDLRPELQQIISLARQQEDCIVKYNKASVMDKLTGNRPHQKVILDCRALQYSSLESLHKLSSSKSKKQQDRPLVFLALDQVQDPMNFGAVLRSALYFGVDAIVSTKRNGCPLSPVVSKASSGAMEWLPVYDVENLSSYLMQRKNSGWDVLGTMSCSRTKTDENEREVVDIINLPRLTKNTVLVVGNEGAGMSEAVADSCTQFISIVPKVKLKPGMESLNLSVATGALLHTLMSQGQQEKTEVLSRRNSDRAKVNMQ